MTFDLWFAADVGQDPSFTLKPRVGLDPDTPVKVEIGSAPTGLPNGLTADLRYVCREGATRVRGRLSVGIEAGQRGQRHRGGREGQSHSVAVEVGRGEPTPAVGASSAATASPNASPSAVSTPPLELVALARKVRVPAEENVPYRVELDAIFVTEPDRSEEEHDVAEELNMRRYPDREGRFLEAGKRPFKIDVSFSTEPSRPIRTLAPFALEDSCRRGLAKEGAVLMAISINGQVDVEAKGSNIEKGPPPETVAVPQPSPEVDQPARPERRPGMATVDLCVPRPVQVTLDTTASAVAAGKLMTDRTKVDVTARCPSREEILRREATALGIPPATLAKLIQSGERVLTLLAAEPGRGDEGPLPLLARASYALASSMAADCPQELSRKPPGAQAVLRGLMQKYAGR